MYFLLPVLFFVSCTGNIEPIPKQDELAVLRSEINALDDQLLEVLSNRMAVVEKIAHYKKAQKMTALQANRWQEVVKTRVAKGAKLGLPASLLEPLLEVMHQESLRRENLIIRP